MIVINNIYHFLTAILECITNLGHYFTGLDDPFGTDHPDETRPGFSPAAVILAVVTMVTVYYRMCSIMRLVFWLVQESE